MSEFEEVRRCASRREAEQLALVLAAVGIAEPAGAAADRGGDLDLRRGSRGRALAARDLRARERAPAPTATPGCRAPSSRGWPAALVYAMVLLFFFGAQRRELWSLDWLRRRRRAGGPDPGRPMVARGHGPHPPRRPRPPAGQPPGRRRHRHRHRPAARPRPGLARDPAGGHARQPLAAAPARPRPHRDRRLHRRLRRPRHRLGLHPPAPLARASPGPAPPGTAGCRRAAAGLSRLRRRAHRCRRARGGIRGRARPWAGRWRAGSIGCRAGRGRSGSMVGWPQG